jgi:hypothetical protein
MSGIVASDVVGLFYGCRYNLDVCHDDVDIPTSHLTKGFSHTQSLPSF